MTAKMGFPLAFLLFSIWFTFESMQFQFLTDNSRPGPGFFPLIIGILLIIFSGLASYKNWREYSKNEDAESEEKGSEGKTQKVFIRDMVWVIITITLFVGLLKFLGATITTFLYVLASLLLFNRKRKLQNILITILVPVGIFFVFDLWLNASLPKGLFELNDFFQN